MEGFGVAFDLVHCVPHISGFLDGVSGGSGVIYYYDLVSHGLECKCFLYGIKKWI